MRFLSNQSVLPQGEVDVLEEIVGLQQLATVTQLLRFECLPYVLTSSVTRHQPISNIARPFAALRRNGRADCPWTVCAASINPTHYVQHSSVDASTPAWRSKPMILVERNGRKSVRDGI